MAPQGLAQARARAQARASSCGWLDGGPRRPYRVLAISVQMDKWHVTDKRTMFM